MVNFHLKKCAILFIGFFTISCNLNSKIPIIDPIETKIVCNCEFRKNTPLNVIIYNPDVKKELNGAVRTFITFDTIAHDSINPLVIKDVRIVMIRLKDAITDEYIFQQFDFDDMNEENSKIFHFYKEELHPIIMNMKCWLTYSNNLDFPWHNKISYVFSFKVKPCN